MASVGSLRRDIRNMEEQLDQLNRRQNKIREELQAQNGQRIRELEEKYRNLLEQKEEENAAALAVRLQDVQEQLLKEYQSNIEQLQKAEAEAKKEREGYLKELQKSYDDLNRKIHEIEAQEEAQDQITKEMAVRISREAEEAEKKVRQEPHEFFFPDQLGIIREHMQKAAVFMKKGMYSTAAAMADAAVAEMELLEIRTKQERQEWTQMYAQYKEAAVRMYRMKEDFEKMGLRTEAGEFFLKEQERQYWSSQGYTPVSEKVSSVYEMVRKIEEVGISSFLKEGKAFRKYQFAAVCRDMGRLEDSLTAVITCIRNERSFSDERYMLGEAAADYYEKQGYRVCEEHFRYGKENLREEPLECFDVEVSLNGLDKIHISFVPCRRDGVTVRNECIVSADVSTIPERAIIQDLADQCRKRMQSIKQDLRVTCFMEGQPQKQRHEEALKQIPDPEQLVKKLEKKY